MNFSIRVKTLRTTKGITQKQLADALHISVAAVRGWERGKAVPYSRMIKKLAEYFEVSADYLLGRTENIETVFSRACRTEKMFSPDEQLLMKMYRNLPAELKSQVQTYIELINRKV